MARVTIEDCILKVPNRFDLVMLASRRARDISSGSELTIERDRDKNPVVALREIAEERVDFDELRESAIQSLQRFVESDESEEEIDELGVPTELKTSDDGGRNMDEEMAEDMLAITKSFEDIDDETAAEEAAGGPA